MVLSTQNRAKTSFKSKRAKLINKYSSKINYKAYSDADSDRSQGLHDSNGKASKSSNFNAKKTINKQIQQLNKKYSNHENEKFTSNGIKRKLTGLNSVNNGSDNVTGEDLILKRLKINNNNLNETKTNYELCNQSIQNLKSQLKLLDDQSANPELSNIIIELEKSYCDRIQLIDEWFDRKKQEIVKKYDCEVRTALGEFNEKSKELKESLKNEYEDKRRLIEIERAVLDITVDTNELKPTVTRKLRRRGNFNEPAPNFVVSSYISATSSVVALGSASSTQTVNNTQTTSIFSVSTNAILVSSSTSSERKRRPSPSNQVTYALNEDEIGDDVKYLFKNLNSYPQKFVDESANRSQSLCTD